MREAVIVSVARTAIGNFGGTLQDVPAVKLQAIAIQGALKKVGVRPGRSPQMDALAPKAFQGVGETELDNPQSCFCHQPLAPKAALKNVSDHRGSVFFADDLQSAATNNAVGFFQNHCQFVSSTRFDASDVHCGIDEVFCLSLCVRSPDHKFRYFRIAGVGVSVLPV